MAKLYVRVTGGLGNQMFQLFKALGLNLENGKPIMLVDKYQNDFLRSKSFTESASRDFSLEKLGLVDNAVTFRCLSPELLCRFIFKFRLAKVFGKSGVLRLFGNIYLDEYFIKDESFGELIPWISCRLRKSRAMSLIEGAAIHVRAGDLLRQPDNLLITRDYYEKSMEMLARDFGVYKFLIVTEDIEFAKSYFTDLDVKYRLKYQASSETEDFITLIRHQYLITANSTFSWIAGLVGFADFFISPEYFYKPADKPKIVQNEIVMSFTGDIIHRPNNLPQLLE